MTGRLTTFCSVWLAVLAAASAAWGQGTSQIIATTGDPAPDGNGTFSAFNYSFDTEYYALNNAGQVVFWAALEGTSGGFDDDEGYFLGAGGAITQIARAGQPAPDGNGTFSDFGYPMIFEGPRLNDAGQAAFSAYLTGTSGEWDDNRGIFRGAGGAITQIGRAGQPAPDGNGAYSYLGDPGLNDAGQAAFSAGLTGTSGGTTDDSGIFRGDGATTTQIVRKGQTAPDFNGTFDWLDYSPALSDAGQVAFSAGLSGTSGGDADNSGTFRGAGGAITQIARAGQGAPDANGVFAGFFSPVALNDAGQVAFSAYLTGTTGGADDSAGIFRGAGGVITQIVRAGQPAPDGNGTFSSFGNPCLNDAGQAAFSASLAGTSGGMDDDTGIFRGAGGAVAQIVRAGQLAPDGNGEFSYFPDWSMNGGGQVAFRADLTGTSGGWDDASGIYLTDGVELVQIARKGEPLAGSTITGLGFAGGRDEEASGLNDSAQVAYRAQLANGKEVMVLFSPEVHWRGPTGGSWDEHTNWTFSIPPAPLTPVFIDTSASLTVDGPASDTTVESLQVGGGAGLATLRLQYGATLAATGGVTVQSTGTITGDGILEGEVTNHGEILAENVTVNGTLANHGVIRGPGRIDAAIANAADGEVRVASGQSLRLTGPSLTNDGHVEVFDGELEVSGSMVNSPDGVMTARDAMLRFHGGLTNAGQIGITFGTTTDFFGDVENTGSILIGGGAQVTFQDDLVQNGTVALDTSGSTPGELIILGELSGTGSFTGGTVYIGGTLSPGNSPGEMSYDGKLCLGGGAETRIELAGESVYDRLLVSGDLVLDGKLSVQLLDGFQPGAGDAFDVLDWDTLSGTFSQVSLPELSPGLGWDTSRLYSSGTLSVVPEPGTLALLLAAAFLLAAWRKIR